MRTFIADIRHALRLFGKSPGFTIAALATLAIAIGANTTIFSVANGVLFAPLPYPDPDRLTFVVRTAADGPIPTVSVPRFDFWRQHSKSFESLAVYDDIGSGFNLTGDGPPERIVGSRVSFQFLKTLGVAPALGRDLTADDDRPNGPNVALLSDGLWRRRFGGDPKVLGRTVRLNGEPTTLVGVLPRSFDLPTQSEIWVPLKADPADADDGDVNYLRLVGRLAEGATLASAKAEAAVLNEKYRLSRDDQEFDPNDPRSATVEPLRRSLGADYRQPLLILLGAVGFVLLIACVNIANLQLARSAARQRELAIRSALGASRGRVVRQLLTESLVLAFGGGLLGLGLGALAIRPLLALVPAGLEPAVPIGIDVRVVGFSLLLSLVAGVLFGLAPTFERQRDLAVPLREGSARTTTGRGGLFARRLLVIGEVALALVLLVGAGVLVRSFLGIIGTAPGYDVERVITFRLSLPEGQYADPLAVDRLGQNLEAALSAIPGAESATLASALPLGPGPDISYTVPSRDGQSEDTTLDAQTRPISNGYFSTLGIAIQNGRAFDSGDRPGGRNVAILSANAAKKYYPNGGAVGARLYFGGPDADGFSEDDALTIVGVAADVREVGLDQAAPPIVYLPFAQLDPGFNQILVRLLPASVAVRAKGSPAALASSLEQAVWSVNPELPVTNVLLGTEVVAQSVGRASFSAFLLGALALFALLLAAVGIYGVLSYLVEQRTRELGVRLALGASAPHVLGLVLRQGTVAIAFGIALGLGGAFAATRALASLLVGVSALDPLAFALATSTLALVAFSACAIPAWRASRLDPLVALRRD